MGAWTRLLLFCVTILLHFEKKNERSSIFFVFLYFKNLRFPFLLFSLPTKKQQQHHHHQQQSLVSVETVGRALYMYVFLLLLVSN